jgi:hypothetical protein
MESSEREAYEECNAEISSSYPDRYIFISVIVTFSSEIIHNYNYREGEITQEKSEKIAVTILADEIYGGRNKYL